MNRILLLAAASIVILISLFSHLGAVGFIGPDEPRYCWIARDMAVTIDWVTPRLYGQPWFEKPALYYWAAALGFKLHLPPEWAGRLPSALAALLATLGIAWVGWRFDKSENIAQSAALWSPLIFATSVAAISFARAAGPDMLFTAGLALAMASAATVLHSSGALRFARSLPSNPQRSDHVPLALFGAFLGLAVLVKGPAGIILAGGAILIWAIATKKWRAAIRLAHPIAIAAFCIVALPWYILCALRNPDFIRIFIYEHNFGRYLTNEFQHRQPFWFFVPIFLLALLPWTALLIPAAQGPLQPWREKSWTDSPGFFFACWAVFPVLFFSFSQSKLPGYILPAIPPACVVLGIAGARKFRSSDRVGPWLPALLCAPWLALPLAMFFEAKSLLESEDPRLALACASLILSFALAFAATWRYSRARLEALFALTLVLTLVSVELAGVAILPVIDPLISSRHASALAASVPVDHVRVFQISRSSHFGLSFYLRRDIPEWSPDEPGVHWVFTTIPGEMELMKSAASLAVVGMDSPRMILLEVKAANR